MFLLQEVDIRFAVKAFTGDVSLGRHNHLMEPLQAVTL
jgi:hypothetical protein